MKDSKAVNVSKKDIQTVFNLENCIWSNKILVEDPSRKNVVKRDFASQYNSKRREEICTCKTKRNKYYISSQVYRSQNKYINSNGLADIGIGSVKVLTKRRVTKIYLPEKVDVGVGSSELIPTPAKAKNWDIDNNNQNKTSSKCIGGVTIYANVYVIDKKLSPIVQTKSGATSPELINGEIKNNNSVSCTVTERDSRVQNNINVNLVSENTEQKDTIVIFKFDHNSRTQSNKSLTNREPFNPPTHKKSSEAVTANNEKKNLSSDSLVQQIYNLENSSFDKQSKISLNPMENKLETEYRKIFRTKSKQNRINDEKTVPDLKSASLLRKRFEALRKGLGRKRDSKKNSIAVKTSSHESVPSRKNVSIVSDPPSLEARSFSNTKLFSPKESCAEVHNTAESVTNVNTAMKQGIIRHNMPSDILESEYQGVQGMFKLWGRKFDLDEDEGDKVAHPDHEIPRSIDNNEKLEDVKKNICKNKKEGNIFSFFKKKQKSKERDKLSNPYKSAKGVTAGRCEVGDGITMKIGLGKECNLKNFFPPVTQFNEDYSTILRETWLRRFLTSQTDLKNSAHVRWNNKMYTTSSSTVFELMDCLYKNNTDIVRSRSDMETEISSIYCNPRPKVNFMKQDVKAFMIPNTILDFENLNKKSTIIKRDRIRKSQNKNIEVKFSNQKLFVVKSEAFSQNIEIVLHSNNFVRTRGKRSSKYIFINIPEGYFSDSTSENSNIIHSSNEKVYKIIEYEAPYSIRNLNKKKERNLDTGDHIPKSNDISVTVSITVDENNESRVLETTIQKPSLHRDVVIQGSDVLIPKRCDVIGIGIITQKDIRGIKKPILKIQEYLSDEESDSILIPQKKCELAESYLQDYYNNCTPFGIDLYSSYVSDSQIRRPSNNNSSNSLNNQGDGSKSCQNISDNYQASTIVSSCETSSCSQCRGFSREEDKIPDDGRFSKYVNKLIKRPCDYPLKNDGKRVQPKDSLEVFRKRKLYAVSNKSNWRYEQETTNPSEPYSVPSVEDKCAQNSADVGPTAIKQCCKRTEPKKRYCQKRVLLQDCDTMNSILTEALSNKCIEGILSFKKSTGCDICKNERSKCPTHIRVVSKPICEIPQPACKDSCIATRNPACNKKNSSSCNVQIPPSCPAGPPNPCQDPCPSKPPPCQIVPPCMSKSSCVSLSPKIFPPSSKLPPCPPKSPPCPPESPSCPPKPPPCPPKSVKSPCESPPPYHDPTLTVCSPSSKCPSKSCNPKPTPPRVHTPPISNKISSCSSPRRQRYSVSCGSHHESPRSRSSPCRCSAQSSPPSPNSQRNLSLIKTKNQSPLGMFRSTKKTSSTTLHKRPRHQQTSCTNLAAKSPCSCSFDTCPNSSRPKSCTSLSKKASSKETCTSKNPVCSKSPTISQKASGMSFTMAPEPCHKSNNVTGAFKRFIHKVASNLSASGHECKPNLPCISQPKPVCSKNNCNNPPKLTGLHLKKMPLHKKSDCSDTSNHHELIRLNSREELLIKIRQSSPSTDEIRENCNIKVQDEDGRTLYERKDYRKHRPYEVRDIFRDSYVNRVSTANTANEENSESKNEEIKPDKNNSNSCSVVEINLTLKFKEKHKSREIGVNNYGNSPPEEDCVNCGIRTPKEVFLVQDQSRSHTKNDIKDLNIKVTIKNYKQMDTPVLNENLKEHLGNDEFSQKISNKFKTVSTGYSEILLNQQAYSIQTRFNSNEPQDKSNSEHMFGPNSVHMMNLENTVLPRLSAISLRCNENLNPKKEKIKLSKSSITVKSKISHNADEKIVGNSIQFIDSSSNEPKKNNIGNSTVEERATDVKIENEYGDTKAVYSDQYITTTPHTYEEKKEKLKNIFKTENKPEDKKEKLKEMLRDIFTSESNETIVSNQLVDEVTYASLKPNFFRDKESMNSYCHIETSASEKESDETKTDTEYHIYPTEEEDNDNSEISNPNVNKHVGCLCSHVAAKLNINPNGNGGCCCRVKQRHDKETYCDFREEHHLNYNTHCVNVETQSSKFDKLKSITMAEMSAIITVDKLVSNQGNNTSKDRCILNKKSHKCTLNNMVPYAPDDKTSHLNGKIKNYIFKPEDILQLNETKKAVLEIYAEHTVSGRRQHVVARLPKFVANTEREMCSYEEVFSTYRSIKNGKTNQECLSIGL